MRLNSLDVKVGERFKGQNKGAVFRITKIENEIAIVKDEKTGKSWQYGVDALKRLKVIKI